MIRTLIAVTTCHARRGQAEAQQSTWAKNLPNVKFFLGGDDAVHDNEVLLNVDDSYAGLPAKVKATCRWALDHGYEAMLKLDDDVYLVPERFYKAGFEMFDYVGNFRMWNGKYPHDYASGFAYYLGGKALEIIAYAPLTDDSMEDRWVGNTLGPFYSRLRLHDEKRFACLYPTGIEEGKFLWGCPVGKTCIAIAQYPAHKFADLHYWYQRAQGMQV